MSESVENTVPVVPGVEQDVAPQVVTVIPEGMVYPFSRGWIWATISLVLSVVGLVFQFLAIPNILALVFAYCAIRETTNPVKQNQRGRSGSKGLGIAAVVFGWLSFFVTVLVVVAGLLFGLLLMVVGEAGNQFALGVGSALVAELLRQVGLGGLDLSGLLPLLEQVLKLLGI